MKVFQANDIHFCPKYLDEVTRCFTAAIEAGRSAEIAVLAGDLFDERLEQNSPALMAAVDAVKLLASYMPVLILQGTYSHDAPGALDIFKRIRGDHPIAVVDQICQVAFADGKFYRSDDWCFDNGCPNDTQILFSCLPSINKGAVAASVGTDKAAMAAGELVAQVLAGWGPINERERGYGVPTVMVSHGTVSGCETETGCPMAGADHEFTTATLFASKASAIMLGHIHKHQAWYNDFLDLLGKVVKQALAYGGSIGRFHFGEVDEKGALLWDVEANGARFERLITPARVFVDLHFPGLPDPAVIATAKVTGSWVRLRYSVDEEHRQIVDRDALRQQLLAAGAAEVKIEPTINPIQRQRAAGIGAASTVADQVRKWCELTSTEPAPVLSRLEQLEHAA